jgi:ubiquitin carboxyl-terminal hydrolase 25/28
MRSPRLKDEWARLLVDKTLIKARAEKAMAAEPGRFEGHAVPSPSEVLTNLRSYISNAMTSPEPRRILRNNKKWLLCLGDSCAELLHYMGFRRTVSRLLPQTPFDH